jgi:hypothetical protein
MGSVRMHSIAPAIAGSLRTSMAPAGSSTLPPSGILPLRLGVQLSRGRRGAGARSSCGVASSAAGQRGGCPVSSLSHVMHLPEFTAVGRLGFAGWIRGQPSTRQQLPTQTTAPELSAPWQSSKLELEAHGPAQRHSQQWRQPALQRSHTRTGTANHCNTPSSGTRPEARKQPKAYATHAPAAPAPAEPQPTSN